MTNPHSNAGPRANIQGQWHTRLPLGITQCLLALSSAVLLNFCFPLTGPMRPWRGAIGWIALVPLLVAILSERATTLKHPLRRSFLIGYLCGFIWYTINSYWIYVPMHSAGVSATGSAAIVALYSAVLGLYFGLFAWAVALLRRRLGLTLALCLAPILWPSVELLAYHLTRVPWDQFGYSQIENFWLIRIAPWAGTYGIAAVLVAGNALFAAALLLRPARLRMRLGVLGLLFAGILQMGTLFAPKSAPTSATALLLQVNLGVNNQATRESPAFYSDLLRFSASSSTACTPYYPGLYGLTRTEVYPDCAKAPSHPNLIVWPEAPTPFIDEDPVFRSYLEALTKREDSAAFVGDIAVQYFMRHGRPASAIYNSASFFNAKGQYDGRYDKIHLVPFGEYVPYQKLFFWAGSLVDQIGTFTHGWRRVVFHDQGHVFGIFICYESVFSNEVRLFAKKGAQVFINISDDDWYGNTSAPWQHLNMARMRAVENHRWLLLDTNNGVTCVVDPEGRVTQSIALHTYGALAARYGYESDTTFYTRYGDVFAFLCSAISLGALGLALFRRKRI